MIDLYGVLFVCFLICFLRAGFPALAFKIEWPDLTNKNIGHAIKFEFQLNNEDLFSVFEELITGFCSCSKQ